MQCVFSTLKFATVAGPEITHQFPNLDTFKKQHWIFSVFGTSSSSAVPLVITEVVLCATPEEEQCEMIGFISIAIHYSYGHDSDMLPIFQARSLSLLF